MANKVKVSLSIIEFDCSPEDITAQLSVQPTFTWVKGDLISPKAKGGSTYTVNGWELSSGIAEDNDYFQDHIEALYQIIYPHLDKFIEVCNKYWAELACVIYISQDDSISTPWIHFDKAALKLFAQLGAEIDFDTYLIE